MASPEAKLQQKSDQLAAVREISRAIAEAQDLDDTLDLITRRTTEVMHVDSCSVYLYNQTRTKLMLAATTGLNKAGIGYVFLMRGKGLTGWVAEHQEPVVVTDAFADDRFFHVVGSGESKYASLMAMPLATHGKVIGGLNVQTAATHQFSEDEVELFGFITELAAIALEKAQLAHIAVVQEMHHRVKNNLQTIAMLLRLQMGQPKKLSPQNLLNETINRVLSIATVHEILSEEGVDEVGTLDLIKRVSSSISSNMVNPEATITVSVSGDNIELSSQFATSLALIANELLQNALEHGMTGRSTGQVAITLADSDHSLHLKVCDNGHGLPPTFSVETDLGLGLNIVRTMVLEDLRGMFHIGPAHPQPGTLVEVSIPKKGLVG